jgi:hypothetical protein
VAVSLAVGPAAEFSVNVSSAVYFSPVFDASFDSSKYLLRAAVVRRIFSRKDHVASSILACDLASNTSFHHECGYLCMCRLIACE